MGGQPSANTVPAVTTIRRAATNPDMKKNPNLRTCLTSWAARPARLRVKARLYGGIKLTL
jgi:hypothetical protein